MGKARQIKDFPGYYITDDGKVYSRNYHKTGRIKQMTPSKDGKGYLFVPLCKNGKRYLKKVHRLVAEAFIPNPDNKDQINHISGNKTDNRIQNLEWCSCEENIHHEYFILKKGARKPKIVLQINNGIFMNEFESIRDAEKHTHINHSNISKCCNGKYKHAGGYQWQYK